MKNRMTYYFISASLILLMLLSGCGTSASYFYLLTPANNYQQTDQNQESAISIGIGSIEFPDYLRKPQIVTYGNNNEIYFDEFNRWAEPLEENFTRVIIENLSDMIPTNNIYIYMWPEEKSNIFQIAIKIDQFGLRSDSTVVLDARWSVSASNKKTFLITQKSSYLEKIENPDYNKTAAAMSKLTGNLCKDIALEVKKRASNN